MKSAKPSIKDPTPDRAAAPVRVALKVQRRRYGRDALMEIGIHHFLRLDLGPCRDLVDFTEAFFHDGHVCMACGLHGRALDSFVERGALPIAEVRAIARQLLTALERMHAKGFVHTDVKPQNILYRRTPRPHARLGDLGNADNNLRQGCNPCTRNYTPPEVLLGHPLGPALDLWSLGCTLYELATGRPLFDPRAAATRKYREFNQPAPEGAFDPSVAIDEAAETAEQYAPGTILGGKYRLESKLGQGKFATVWRALVLHQEPLDGTYDTLSAHCAALEASAACAGVSSDPQDSGRAWRKARGAQDLHDLVLNYEHLVLMQELLGRPPTDWVVGGRFSSAYLTADGRLKHDRATVAGRPMVTRLKGKMPAADARELASFILPLLAWEPALRPEASEWLAHPWLKNLVVPSGRLAHCR